MVQLILIERQKMTWEEIDQRVRQIYSSFSAMKSDDFSKVVPNRGYLPDGRYLQTISFSAGESVVDWLNVLEKLIDNIARIKDYLKVWCDERGLAFVGEQLIDGDQSVGVIHDLWNAQKHGKLNRKPRSGHVPHLANVKRVLQIRAEGPSTAYASTDPATGKFVAHTSGNASATLTIMADVVDENGARLGDLRVICEKAVAQWEKKLIAAGVPIHSQM